MSTHANGGPAFPGTEILRTASGERIELNHQDGMTLRDWFAGKALAGFMASKDRPTTFHPEQDAAWCYLIADAMLKAREA